MSKLIKLLDKSVLLIAHSLFKSEMALFCINADFFSSSSNNSVDLSCDISKLNTSLSVTLLNSTAFTALNDNSITIMQKIVQIYNSFSSPLRRKIFTFHIISFPFFIRKINFNLLFYLPIRLYLYMIPIYIIWKCKIWGLPTRMLVNVIYSNIFCM